MANFRAWALTSAPVFICHDDIVWTSGPVFHPHWYRRFVFPRYRKLWSVLKDAGKIVLFCSDGDFTEFVDDLAQAGADGFIFEPLTSLEKIVSTYGRSKAIIGNVDTRILTFGTRDDVYREVKRCYDLGRDCPGFFHAVGNHIPHNVPVDNALYYLDLINTEFGRR
jgi:uroporphyrinogen-III decarboxylase